MTDPAYTPEQQAKYHRRTAARIRGILHEAKDVPCADCGVRYPPYVMQFDHVRGEKLFELGVAPNRHISEARVRDELAKCEVVCANCHAERTWGPK